MEDYLNYKSYRILEKIQKSKISEIIREIKSMQGIENIKCSGQIVSVIYNPYLISEKEVIEKLAGLGFSVKPPGKKSFKQRMEKWAENNTEILGDKELNCCNLNQIKNRI